MLLQANVINEVKPNRLFEAKLTVNSGAGPGETPREGFFGLPPSSVVYWFRLSFAIIAGFFYNIVGLGLQGVLLGTLGAIGVGILFYAVSVYIVKNIFHYGEAELKGPRKHVSLGWGSYIIWLIFTIVLFNTILYAHA